MRSHEFAPGLQIRGIEPPLRLADYKPVAFDRDSTLINVECVDEIADVVGRKAEIAGAAMRGEIADYKDSLINLSAPSTSPRTASALAAHCWSCQYGLGSSASTANSSSRRPARNNAL